MSELHRATRETGRGDVRRHHRRKVGHYRASGLRGTTTDAVSPVDLAGPGGGYFVPLRCFSKNARAAFHAFSASAPLKPWPAPSREMNSTSTSAALRRSAI